MPAGTHNRIFLLMRIAPTAGQFGHGRLELFELGWPRYREGDQCDFVGEQ